MCTVLLYLDAKGRPYVGRSNEFIGIQPDSLTYYPVGTTIESITPDQKPGMKFQTKYAVFGATLRGMTANAKQDALHEAANDQGLTFTANSLSGNKSPDVSKASPAKILSAIDLGMWALGSFSTVAAVKNAILNKDVEIWLPVISSLGTEASPVHFALWDTTGAGIVIEWTNGFTEVHDNLVGVMTNNPPFPWHLENMKNYAYLTNVDKNSEKFNKLNVAAPDSGGNMSGLPSSEISWGRFVKAAYYSNFAFKADTPEFAIITLGHIMNNFDRPINISVDTVNDPPGGERDMSTGKGASTFSEITAFIVLHDLTQQYFYIRTVFSLNFTKFDIRKLGSLKKTTAVPFDLLNKNESLDGMHLFLS